MIKVIKIEEETHRILKEMSKNSGIPMMTIVRKLVKENEKRFKEERW